MRRALAPLFPPLVLGLCAVLLVACHQKTEKSSAAALARPVQVAVASETRWPRVVNVPGTVSAVDTAVLASRAGGWVTRVTVDAGARVVQGALLAEVGAPDARGRLAEAEARASAAEAELKDATANERRYSALYSAHAASAQQHEEAERRFIAAKAGMAAATSALAVAKSNVGYAEIRAPFAGIVAEKKVWPGDFAAPGSTLFVMAGDTPEIRAHVGPLVYPALKVGERAEVVIDSRHFPAFLSRAVAAADPATRTHLIELRLGSGAEAQFGAYAEVRLTVGAFPALTVPVTSLTRRAGLLGVFVVDKNHRAHFRLVRAGEARDGRVPIAAGLAAGEAVIVAPTPDLANDSLVTPEPSSPATVAPGTRRG